jgi:hypothetical protein
MLHGKPPALSLGFVPAVPAVSSDWTLAAEPVHWLDAFDPITN